jgi:hypothetical protein
MGARSSPGRSCLTSRLRRRHAGRAARSSRRRSAVESRRHARRLEIQQLRHRESEGESRGEDEPVVLRAVNGPVVVRDHREDERHGHVRVVLRPQDRQRRHRGVGRGSDALRGELWRRATEDVLLELNARTLLRARTSCSRRSSPSRVDASPADLRARSKKGLVIARVALQRLLVSQSCRRST